MELRCSSCGSAVRVKASFQGKRVPCMACGTELVVLQEDASAAFDEHPGERATSKDGTGGPADLRGVAPPGGDSRRASAVARSEAQRSSLEISRQLADIRASSWAIFKPTVLWLAMAVIIVVLTVSLGEGFADSFWIYLLFALIVGLWGVFFFTARRSGVKWWMSLLVGDVVLYPFLLFRAFRAWAGTHTWPEKAGLGRCSAAIVSGVGGLIMTPLSIQVVFDTGHNVDRTPFAIMIPAGVLLVAGFVLLMFFRNAIAVASYVLAALLLSVACYVRFDAGAEFMIVLCNMLILVLVSPAISSLLQRKKGQRLVAGAK